MKKSNSNPNGEVVNKASDDNSTGRKWGFGSFLKGLGTYLRPKDSTLEANNTVIEQTNRKRATSPHSVSSIPITPPARESRVSVVRHENVGHSDRHLERWRQRCASPLSVSSRTDLLRKSGSSYLERPLRGGVQYSSPQTLPRFKKLSSPPYVLFKHSIVAIYIYATSET